jgi:hypothetical protein
VNASSTSYITGIIQVLTTYDHSTSLSVDNGCYTTGTTKVDGTSRCVVNVAPASYNVGTYSNCFWLPRLITLVTLLTCHQKMPEEWPKWIWHIPPIFPQQPSCNFIFHVPHRLHGAGSSSWEVDSHSNSQEYFHFHGTQWFITAFTKPQAQILKDIF